MSTITYVSPSGSLPIVATIPPLVLPVSLSDMQTALGANAVLYPGAPETMSRVVSAQATLATLTPGTAPYASLLSSCTVMLREIGLYPAGTAAGPSPAAGS